MKHIYNFLFRQISKDYYLVRKNEEDVNEFVRKHYIGESPPRLRVDRTVEP